MRKNEEGKDFIRKKETTKMNHRPYRNKEFLKQKYLEEGLSVRAIGKMCNTSPGTVHRWLKRHKIKTRNMVVALELHRKKKEEDRKKEELNVEDIGLALAIAESLEKAEKDAEFLSPEELERREEKRMERANELHSARLKVQERKALAAKLKRERLGKNPGSLSWSG